MAQSISQGRGSEDKDLIRDAQPQAEARGQERVGEGQQSHRDMNPPAHTAHKAREL